MRVLLISALVTAACATTQFPPPHSQVEYYHPRVEQIVERLRMAIPEKDRPPQILYQVWSTSQGVAVSDTFATDPSSGIIYLHTMWLEINDDALAVGLGHEIYHVLEHRGIKPLVALGWVGGSAGAGATVGYFTTWWVGLLTGGSAFLIVLPPLLLAGIRDAEDNADRFGVALAWQAGYNAHAGVEGWCRIHTEIDHLNGEDPDTRPSAHPSAKERCASMREALARIQWSR